MKISHNLLITILTMSLLISCSGSDKNPVTPSQTPNATLKSNSNAGASCLWGVWDVSFDLETRTLDITPLRGIAFTANVTQFVDGPPVNMVTNIGEIDVQPDYMDIPVDVSLTHPFPGMNLYTGFDVMGVFLSDGTGTYLGEGGLNVASVADPRLLNPDGYTRWFNAPEFADAGQAMPLLGYVPGTYATPNFTPNAELNPYKYFATGLDIDGSAFDFLVNNSEDRGSFLPGTVNHRQYNLRFPIAGGINFQYAVISHWEDPGMPDPTLQDFTPETNVDEAVVASIEDSSWAFYEGPGNFGGKVILDISIWDWSAVYDGSMDEYEVKLYSIAWAGAYDVNMIPVGDGTHYYTYHAEIDMVELTSNEALPVWIDVSYPGKDYSNTFSVDNLADGLLSGYFLHEVNVLASDPTWIEVLIPNGGEEWAPKTDQEITWDSGFNFGTIEIDYSKDNFISDVNSIATAEEDDGSFLWENIPDDPSTTVKVRVSSTTTPSMYDISDDDFTILDGWIEVTSPAGGEEWVPGDDEFITWISQNISGTVFIEWSLDNFVSDLHSITTGEANDGSYLWQNLPQLSSDQVRVRITSTNDGSYYGISEEFKIDVSQGWARTYSNVLSSWAWGVAAGPDGNSYITGHTSMTTSPPYNNDIFLVKYDPLGVKEWDVTFGGPDYENGNGICVDQSGNIYVTGYFQDTAEFDPDGGNELTSVGNEDAYLTKFDSSGQHLWAISWGGTGWETGRECSTDSEGNVYVTGWFHNTVDMDPGPGVYNRSAHGNSFSDVFLTKFDSSGNFVWCQTWGDNLDESGHGLELDGNDNIYMVGLFEGEVDFDPGPGVDMHEGHSKYGLDTYLSKFDSDGNWHWARSWFARAFDVAVDDAGNAYPAGYFGDFPDYNEPVDFDPGPGEEIRTPDNSRDCFASKFDSNGNFQWVSAWGGPGVEYCYGVALHGTDNLYYAGKYSETADFDPGPGEDNHTAGLGGDLFLTKLDSSGALQWARTWGGNWVETCYGAEVDAAGNVFAAGVYESDDSVDFAPSGAPCYETPEYYSAAGSGDAFIVKYLPDGCW